MTSYRFAVDVMPRDGILDPQGRAVEAALPKLGSTSVRDVRVGRRVELSIDAGSQSEAHDVIHRLAADFLANPLIEKWEIEALEHVPGLAVKA